MSHLIGKVAVVLLGFRDQQLKSIVMQIPIATSH